MKNIVIGIMTAFALGQMPPLAHSQGTTTYVSSLGQLAVGNEAVGSDSWVAEMFQTGNNPGGYVFDSVQLAMASASGAPNGFSVDLYLSSVTAPVPDRSIATLNGSSDPETGGIYTYTASDLTLYPDVTYFVVVTAGTTVASGAYDWSIANSTPSTSGGWSGSDTFLTSANGLSWAPATGDPQLAITAAAVPEPNALVLMGLSGLLFLWRRGRVGMGHS